MPSGWELAILAAKLLQYCGIASLAGGTICLLFYRDESRRTVVLFTAYIGLGTLLGFNGALWNFLLQVGMTSGRGLPGIFDPDMGRMLLGFEVGSATLLRLAGFLVSTVACAVFAGRIGRRPPALCGFRVLGILHALALLLVLASFTITGHVSILDLVSRASIVLHMLGMAVWVGSFAPLLYLCLSSGGGEEALGRVMRRFGDMAGVCLPVLFAAGLILVLKLFHTPGQVISTPYGITLLIKLLLVALLLLVAAGNRFVLIPRILAGAGPGRLAGAIRVEIVLAMAILAVTGYLATTVGPPAMPM